MSEYRNGLLIRKNGNAGSSIDRKGADASWERVNVGGSASRVWHWLGERLPSGDLFRSAIYLRQGDADHFMNGNASDRVERFAALLDLGRYTELSQRAKTRGDVARRLQADSTSKLGGWETSPTRACGLRRTMSPRQ